MPIRVLGTTLRTLAVAGLCLVMAPVAAAAAPPAGDEVGTSSEIADLREMLERIERDNAAMREAVDELKAASDEDWMTRARAAEIRSVVEDVLADADTRTSLRGNGLLAGWDGGFFVQDPDGRFRLEVSGVIQTRFILNRIQTRALDRQRSGFEVTRARFTLGGHIIDPSWQWQIRSGATRNVRGLVQGLYVLDDGWIRKQINDSWSVRVGQFQAPFNREELVQARYQQAVERSLYNESINIGRTQGIELEWFDGEQRIQMMISDGPEENLLETATTFDNTFRLNQPALVRDTEWAGHARWERLLAGEWDQFQDITSAPDDQFAVLVGVGVTGARVENIGTFDSDGISIGSEWYGVTGDLSIEWGGANLMGSMTFHRADNGNFGKFDVLGANVQGGVYIAPRHELFLRWEYLRLNAPSLDLVDFNAVTVGWNWYIDGHDVKISVDAGIALDRTDPAWASDIAGWRSDSAADENQLVIRSQMQLLF